MTVPFSRIKVAQDAQPLVEAALGRVAAADAAKVKAALAEAAGEDGNRYLTLEEVGAVVDAFAQAQPDTSTRLGGAALGTALDLAHAEVSAMAARSNVDGVSAHFTFVESLEAKLISELRDTVAKANGRPAEIGMMIFQFQSDEVGAAIATLAKENPHVTFRIIGDAGQASRYGGNELPRLLDLGLPNVQVKFKKDLPYVWSAAEGEPVYYHGASQGLNHHKGFVAVIDGVVDRVVTGSFNWSDTADEKNYEDLVAIRAVDTATRGAAEQYLDEFTGFFNNDQATLSPNLFDNWKREQLNALSASRGGEVRPFTPLPDDAYPPYVPQRDGRHFDVNGFAPEDKARLDALVGRRLGGRIRAERSRYGRYASFEQLRARVPEVAALPEETQEALRALSLYGSHTVSVNTASVEELDLAGFSRAMAQAVVDYRSVHGDFESVDALLDVPGMTSNRMNFARRYLVDDDVEAFFNSRPFGAEAAGTGYGARSSDRNALVMGAGGVQEDAATITSGVTDLFARARAGQSLDVAMYAMSTTSDEYLALVGAASRGVTVRVVLNDGYTAATVRALTALRDAGLPIDVRVQTAKTMHEKFGVVGDDVFFGSANFSESSSTKHSEDRFVVKNNEELSSAFKSQFEVLWARSRIR